MAGNKNSGPPGVPKTVLHRKSISLQHKKILENGEHPLQQMDTCVNCGVTLQANMVRRWHNDRCRNFWSYRSKKLLCV